MSIILSLQGCMAVGKTTAVKYIEENVPYVNVSYEWNNHIIDKINSRNLDKTNFDDYIEIQKIWIENEVLRYKNAIKYKYTIMDFGAEEVEFHTLNYPKSIGQNWDVESRLQDELSQLRKCLPYRILYLEASEKVLMQNKINDSTRTRKSFNNYYNKFLPLKKKWFANIDNVDILNVDNMSKEELGQAVKEWIDRCIAENEKELEHHLT